MKKALKYTLLLSLLAHGTHMPKEKHIERRDRKKNGIVHMVSNM